MLIGAVVNKAVHRHAEGSPLLVDNSVKVGIEVELRGWSRDPTDGDFRSYWEGKEDPSVRETGREFVSKGGLIGTDMVAAIESMYSQMGRRKWHSGYPYAGIHLHVDCTALESDGAASLQRFVGAYMLMEHMFFTFAGEYRRVCGFCYSLEESTGVYADLAHLFGAPSERMFTHTLNRAELPKYQALNLMSLRRFGTVEFRHLPTTEDKERMLLWVNLVIALRSRFHNLPDLGDVTRADIETLLDHPIVPLKKTFMPLFDQAAFDLAKENIQFLLWGLRGKTWVGQTQELTGSTTALEAVYKGVQ